MEPWQLPAADLGITRSMQQHRFFTRNRSGRDFVIGDLHGDYAKLDEALQKQGFDPGSDRLFALGDLIDRGPASARLVGLLHEPWFSSVLGNHELMLLEGLADPSSAELHRINGGDWFYRLGASEQQGIAATLLENLALAFTIETQWGTMGAIHATAPSDWRTVQDVALKPDHWRELVWDRGDYNRARQDPKRMSTVDHVDAVVHGHVSCEAPWPAANRVWIDTLYRGGSPTMLCLDKMPTPRSVL